MSMHRFFKNDILGSDIQTTIDKEDAFHISRVLKLQKGEEIIVCDGNSNDYICEIESVTKSKVIVNVVSKEKNLSESELKIVLFQGVPKSDKMSFIIQKCVELGVFRIVPVITEFAISRPSSGKDNKISRYNKISETAAKQSGRGVIPEVSDVVNFKESIDMMKMLSASFVAYENEEQNKIKSLLNDFKGDSLGIFIGPEGGFSKNEIKVLQENGINSVSLGDRILRTETAGIVALAIINYELENL